MKLLTSYGRRALIRDPSADVLAVQAHSILTKHRHDKIDALTRGRSTAFAASHVELYMRPHNGKMPRVDEVGRGDVKVPPLWHVAAKQQKGRWYTDGSFHGRFPLMASSMELEKDRSFERSRSTWCRRSSGSSRRCCSTSARRSIRTRSTRRSPRKDASCSTRARSAARAVMVTTTAAATALAGTPEDVGTDYARIDVVRPQFIEAFNMSPLADDGALIASEGYAATPLTGVWANYPYLHNGSVPTLWHLLGPASERPAAFEVMAARRFDRERVGQPLHASDATRGLSETALLRRFRDDRNWFVVTRPGSGNGGHDFWNASAPTNAAAR